MGGGVVGIGDLLAAGGDRIRAKLQRDDGMVVVSASTMPKS